MKFISKCLFVFICAGLSNCPLWAQDFQGYPFRSKTHRFIPSPQLALSKCIPCQEHPILLKHEFGLNQFPNLLADSLAIFIYDIQTGLETFHSSYKYGYDQLERFIREWREEVISPDNIKQTVTSYTFIGGADYETLEMARVNNGPWQPTFRSTYSEFPNLQKTVKLTQVYDLSTNSWQDDVREVQLGEAPNPTEYTKERFINGAWRTEFKRYTTWKTKSTPLVWLYQYWNEQVGRLDSTERYSFEYDLSNRQTIEKKELWKEGKGWYVNSITNQNYNADGLLSFYTVIDLDISGAIDYLNRKEYRYRGLQLDSTLVFVRDIDGKIFSNEHTLHEYLGDTKVKDSVYRRADVMSPWYLDMRHLYLSNPAPFNERDPHAVTTTEVREGNQWRFSGRNYTAWSELASDWVLNRFGDEILSFSTPSILIKSLNIETFYKYAKLSGTAETEIPTVINVTPNPALPGQVLRMEGLPESESFDYALFDILGRSCLQGSVDAERGIVLAGNILPGLYQLIVRHKGKVLKQGKVVVLGE